jgi:hypothetical protein
MPFTAKLKLAALVTGAVMLTGPATGVAVWQARAEEGQRADAGQAKPPAAPAEKKPAAAVLGWVNVGQLLARGGGGYWSMSIGKSEGLWGAGQPNSMSFRAGNEEVEKQLTELVRTKGGSRLFGHYERPPCVVVARVEVANAADKAPQPAGEAKADPQAAAPQQKELSVKLFDPELAEPLRTWLSQAADCEKTAWASDYSLDERMAPVVAVWAKLGDRANAGVLVKVAGSSRFRQSAMQAIAALPLVLGKEAAGPLKKLRAENDKPLVEEAIRYNAVVRALHEIGEGADLQPKMVTESH